MVSAAPGPAAALAHTAPSQVPPPPGYSTDISPTVQQQPHLYTSSGMYAYPTTTLATQTYSQAHYPHYPARQYPQQHPQQQHPQQHHHQHAQPHPQPHPQQLPPMAGAYTAATTNPFVQSTMAGTSAAHMLPTATHATADSVPHGIQQWVPSGYPAASSGMAESSTRQESASVRSNDQMSGTVTDASGYSQAYWPHYNATYEHGPVVTAAAAATTAAAVATVASDGYLRAAHHQSPTLVHAQSPLRAATDSPMEHKKSSIDYAAAPAVGRERMQHLADAVSTGPHGAHVTEAGSTGAYHGSPAITAAGPQVHSARLPYSYSATALAPMQEMQEHPQGTAPPMASADASAVASVSGLPAESLPGPSPIAIQSLLNSPEDLVGTRRFPASEQSSQVGGASEDGGGSGTAAIHKHIANENARYRRQSGASGHAPVQSPESSQKPQLPLPQVSRMPSGSMANNDSSPNSL
ncbi:hypothetical protein IWW50_006328, partial [Coemansia erecta]